MDIMLNENHKKQTSAEQNKLGNDTEINRVLVSKPFVDFALNTDWKPGNDAITEKDVHNLSDRLIVKAIKALAKHEIEDMIRTVAASTERR